MQLKPITTIIVLSLLVASLLVAGCVSNTATPTPTTTGTDAFKMQSFIDQVNAHEKGVASQNFTQLHTNASTGDVDGVTWHNDTTIVYIWHFKSIDYATANYDANGS